jgi:hypothetical protein
VGHYVKIDVMAIDAILDNLAAKNALANNITLFGLDGFKTIERICCHV